MKRWKFSEEPITFALRWCWIATWVIVHRNDASGIRMNREPKDFSRVHERAIENASRHSERLVPDNLHLCAERQNPARPPPLPVLHTAG